MPTWHIDKKLHTLVEIAHPKNGKYPKNYIYNVINFKKYYSI